MWLHQLPVVYAPVRPRRQVPGLPIQGGRKGHGRVHQTEPQARRGAASEGERSLLVTCTPGAHCPEWSVVLITESTAAAREGNC